MTLSWLTDYNFTHCWSFFAASQWRRKKKNTQTSFPTTGPPASKQRPATSSSIKGQVRKWSNVVFAPAQHGCGWPLRAEPGLIRANMNNRLLSFWLAFAGSFKCAVTSAALAAGMHPALGTGAFHAVQKGVANSRSQLLSGWGKLVSYGKQLVVCC